MIELVTALHVSAGTMKSTRKFFLGLIFLQLLSFRGKQVAARSIGEDVARGLSGCR